MEPIKEYSVGNKTLKIYVDEQPSTPREWDNMGKMICLHNRYTLGDKHNYKAEDYSGWAEMKKAIIKNENAGVILPLYLYDHSGITMRTTPFGDRWDSGQVGFIVISKEKIKEEYSVKRITQKVIEQATKVAIAEVEIFDQYITGDVYGFKLFENGEETDSCWGFFGSDIKTNGILDSVGIEEFANMEEINLVD